MRGGTVGVLDLTGHDNGVQYPSPLSNSTVRALLLSCTGHILGIGSEPSMADL